MAARFTYRDAGVDREGADRFTEGILSHMRRTYGPQVIDNPGGYGGLFALDGATWLMGRRYRKPVLIGCADGVGTKLKIAFMMDKHDTVGIDLVAMNVNDLLCQGGRPLFFLDYIATGRLDEARLQQVLKGIADGCEQADCALLGGETAQMPDFYRKGEYDLAGFAVGVVERGRLLDGTAPRPGHAVIGLASSGLHSNGFSLVRRVLFGAARMKVSDHVAEFGCTLGEELLRPTRIYVRTVMALQKVYEVKRVPSAIAHITGSGIPGNVPRVVPEGCEVVFRKGSWPVPPIFDLVRRAGDLDEQEMFDTFNMGLGLVLVVPPYYADAVVRRAVEMGERAYIVGEVRPGSRGVRIVD